MKKNQFVFPILGKTVGRTLGKSKVFFGFAWHFCLFFQTLEYKKRTTVLWLPADECSESLILKNSLLNLFFL